MLVFFQCRRENTLTKQITPYIGAIPLDDITNVSDIMEDEDNRGTFYFTVRTKNNGTFLSAVYPEKWKAIKRQCNIIAAINMLTLMYESYAHKSVFEAVHYKALDETVEDMEAVVNRTLSLYTQTIETLTF